MTATREPFWPLHAQVHKHSTQCCLVTHWCTLHLTSNTAEAPLSSLTLRHTHLTAHPTTTTTTNERATFQPHPGGDTPNTASAPSPLPTQSGAHARRPCPCTRSRPPLAIQTSLTAAEHALPLCRPPACSLHAPGRWLESQACHETAAAISETHRARLCHDAAGANRPRRPPAALASQHTQTPQLLVAVHL